MNQSQNRDEVIQFLKQCQLFASLTDEDLKCILEKCTLESYGPGTEIFHASDPSDKIYVIKSGVVEICRTDPSSPLIAVVAYLGERETIGEMSILTGSARNSMIRVPQSAELLAISRDDFMGLLEGIPILAIRLATILGKRLEARIKKRRLQIKGQELSGSLEYFDFSTLIQTLAHSERTGFLTIVDQKDETLAEIRIKGGEVCSARLAHLTGAEAFYQIFQSAGGKAFTFRVGELGKIKDEDKIPYGTMALLFEANRLQDEMGVLKKRIPDRKTTFIPKVREFTWNDGDTMPLARQIWDLIGQGQPLESVLKKVPVSHYSVYRIVTQMLDQGQIGL